MTITLVVETCGQTAERSATPAKGLVPEDLKKAADAVERARTMPFFSLDYEVRQIAAKHYCGTFHHGELVPLDINLDKPHGAE